MIFRDADGDGGIIGSDTAGGEPLEEGVDYCFSIGDRTEDAFFTIRSEFAGIGSQELIESIIVDRFDWCFWPDEVG